MRIEVTTSENAQKQIDEAQQEATKQIQVQEKPTSQGAEKDTTVAKQPIPQTGRSICLGMVLGITVALGIFYKHRYQTIDR